MEYAFDKNYETGLLSNAEIRGKYNSFLTAKQVLSKLSWTFEQARRESDYNLFLDSKEKIIENANHTFGAKEPWEETSLPKELNTALEY